MEHKPTKWVIVYNSPLYPILSAGCSCGDENCSFTATLPESAVVHCPPPVKSVSTLRGDE